ncbi:MAG: protein kinase [Myxococcales bacterium]|nr:protein kinase [Myxococcales bacterium]
MPSDSGGTEQVFERSLLRIIAETPERDRVLVVGGVLTVLIVIGVVPLLKGDLFEALCGLAVVAAVLLAFATMWWLLGRRLVVPQGFEELPSSSPISTTWVGHDPVLNRKVVKKELTDPKRKQEFVEAMRGVAKLGNETHFVTVYTAQAAGDRPHFLMQYAQNGSLREYIEREGRPVAWSTVREVLCRVSEAAEVAHSQGVQLGHLKPSNILRGADGCPLVSPRTRLTFLDRAQLQDALRDGHLTEEDLVYTAPELLTASGGVVSPEKCDQYALGMMAIELLTGELPAILPGLRGAPGELAVEETRTALRERGRAAYQPLPPLHERQLIPRQIGEALEKMTRLDSGARFHSLGKAIDRIRYVERETLWTARDSYARCLEAARTPAFFTVFYQRFAAHDLIRRFFGHFERTDWPKQEEQLRRAIDACFDYVLSPVSGIDRAGNRQLREHARRHADRKIAFEHYKVFSDTLIATVCDGDERFDPLCEDPVRRETIRGAWREMLTLTTGYFLGETGRDSDAGPRHTSGIGPVGGRHRLTDVA